MFFYFQLLRFPHDGVVDIEWWWVNRNMSCQRVAAVASLILCSTCIQGQSNKTEVQRCNSSYAFLERQFLPASVHKAREPVLLLSYQGSGNTWTRLLLEYSTGIYTGSVYSDTTLYDILPAEADCGRTMSVNRAHPDACKISPGPGGYIYPRDKVVFSPLVLAGTQPTFTLLCFCTLPSTTRSG